MMKIKGLFLLLCAVITGCATRPENPAFTEKIMETKYLSFAVWEKNVQKGEPLRVYIEGDGDPTPKKAVGFELAKNDPNQNVIYISRPCQYVDCAECKNPALWKEERFNEEIVDEMKNLVVYLAHKYETPALDLIGYDGGGTMALLIATKIPVRQVVTVGGILDTQSYARENGITLNGLNPVNFVNKLAQVPQVHYIGGRDKKAPQSQAERFIGKFFEAKSIQIKRIPNATHTDWQGFAVE
ncbi:MAG: dienelactone hydrolase family protein [Alphaproteobacteria bacterium]|nr:dienelactone hydrolase family protein [Alphaproteobacteria bacterium]